MTWGYLSLGVLNYYYDTIHSFGYCPSNSYQTKLRALIEAHTAISGSTVHANPNTRFNRGIILWNLVRDLQR